jgi:hypothetical protein
MWILQGLLIEQSEMRHDQGSRPTMKIAAYINLKFVKF